MSGAEDPIQPTDGFIRNLTYTKVGNMRVIQMKDGQPAALPPGAHHAQIEDFMRWEADQLVLSISAFMLTEHAGDPIVKKDRYTFRYTYALKPWWIPGFLWRRVRWAEVGIAHEFATITEPKWKYPYSTHISPLGEPVQMVSFETFGPRESPPRS